MHPCTDRQGKTWHRPALLALNLAWLSLAAPVAEAAPWKIRADTQVQLELRQVGWRLQGPFAEQRVELVLRNPLRGLAAYGTGAGAVAVIGQGSVGIEIGQ